MISSDNLKACFDGPSHSDFRVSPQRIGQLEYLFRPIRAFAGTVSMILLGASAVSAASNAFIHPGALHTEVDLGRCQVNFR